MATAALPVGAEVDCEAAEALEEVLARELVDPVVVADRVPEAVLEPVVVSDEESVELLAVPEVVAVLLALAVLPVMEAVEADPVAVPVAPVMPKLGEKFMLVASVSSMISMVYWNEFTSAASGIWRVALPMEAGIPAVVALEVEHEQVNQVGNLQARTIPLSGVMGCCTSLMVTVPEEGLVQSMTRG